jgi:hypothetical protein
LASRGIVRYTIADVGAKDKNLSAAKKEQGMRSR